MGELMNRQEFKEILRKHHLWLNNEVGGAWTILSGVDLRYVDLTDADLREAVLDDVKLEGVSLFNTVGNNKQIKTIQAGKYTVNYTNDRMQIDCENHLIEEWFNFTDRQIKRMDRGALTWWRVWKPILKQIIEVSPAEK